MGRGTVKFFNQQKGYGFIVPIGKVGSTLPDVFLHMSAVEKAGLPTLSSLRKNQEIESLFCPVRLGDCESDISRDLKYGG